MGGSWRYLQQLRRESDSRPHQWLTTTKLREVCFRSAESKVCKANSRNHSLHDQLGENTMLVTPKAAVVGILKPAEVRRILSASHTTTACADHALLCRVYNTSFFPPSIQRQSGYAVLRRAIHRIHLASLAHAKRTTSHTHFATAWRDKTTREA